MFRNILKISIYSFLTCPFPSMFEFFCADSKAFPTSFSRKDLSVNSLEAGEATFLPTNTHPPESTTVQAQSGSTTHRNSGVSMMAIFSRYFDEIKWLTDPNAGVMDNSTGKPRFIMPIKIYQPADIGQDGLPIFPGYFPPAPLNLTTEEAEATGKNYSNHAYNDAYVARMGLGLGCEEERKQSTRPPGVCRGR